MRKVKGHVIPIRLSAQQNFLIKEAAEKVGENRAEFMRYAVMSRAEEVLKRELPEMPESVCSED